MVRLSIGARISLSTVAVLLGASFLVDLQLTRREHERLVQGKVRAAEMVTDLLANDLVAPLEFDDLDVVRSHVHGLRTNPEIVSVVVWGDGQQGPMATFGRTTSEDTDAPGEPRMQIEPGHVVVVRNIAGLTKPVLATARLVFSLAAENRAYDRAKTQMTLASLVAATLAALVLLVLARLEIVGPVRALMDATGRLARGESSARARVVGRAEFGELAAAFNQMADAVQDRERRLEALSNNLRELFDHMRQAIVAFDRTGRVVGVASRRAEELLGQVQGSLVRQLLYPDADKDYLEATAFDEWLELAFDTDPALFDRTAELAPRDVILRGEDGVRRVLELEFRPLVRQGRVEEIMLLATDVTDTRRLEQAMLDAEAERDRQIAAMRRMIAGGAQTVITGFTLLEERLERCEDALAPASARSAETLCRDVFREVHSLKSEAQALELKELAGGAEDLENELAELRSACASGEVDLHAWRSRLSLQLAALRDALARARDALGEASPIGDAVFDQAPVSLRRLRALREHVEASADHALRSKVERLFDRPFGEVAAPLESALPAWASLADKEVRLIVEGRDVLVPPPLSAALRGALPHLVRNAVAHGIEPAITRTSAGKASRGTIRIAATPTEDGVVVSVEDDGQGLDEAQIRGRAEDGSSVPVTELVFRPGLTTRSSSDTLAGRGVGLDAVLQEATRIGYRVRCTFVPGRFTRFVLSPTEASTREAGAGVCP